MTQQQKDSRAEWRKRALYLIECTKLSHDSEEYMHTSDLIDLLDEVPDYDMGKADKKKYMKMLGVVD